MWRPPWDQVHLLYSDWRRWLIFWPSFLSVKWVARLSQASNSWELGSRILGFSTFPQSLRAVRLNLSPLLVLKFLWFTNSPFPDFPWTPSFHPIPLSNLLFCHFLKRNKSSSNYPLIMATHFQHWGAVLTFSAHPVLLSHNYISVEKCFIFTGCTKNN